MTRLIKWFSVLAIAVFTVVLMPAKPTHAAVYKIQLVSITCINKQDPLNKDKPSIKLDGVTVWSGSKFANGTSASLLQVAPRTFTNQVSMALWEEDTTSADDLLGTTTIVGLNTVGLGNLVHSFQNNNYHYEIVYRVTQ